MIVISNSSPLIALSRIRILFILKELFGEILIPDAVYQETVIETTITVQKENILKSMNDFIKVVTPNSHHSFSRNLGKGEKGVLNLALEKKPDMLIIDDKKARREAQSLGFISFFTTDVLLMADKLKIIFCPKIIKQLRSLEIYLPD